MKYRKLPVRCSDHYVIVHGFRPVISNHLTVKKYSQISLMVIENFPGNFYLVRQWITHEENKPLDKQDHSHLYK